MTEEEAKYTIIEYMPVMGFPKYRQALRTAIEALEKQIDGGWVPCSERLPEHDWYSVVCWVTLKSKFGVVCTRKMRWYGNGRWVWTNGHDLGNEWEVIAWMPYEPPKPYRKGE